MVLVIAALCLAPGARAGRRFSGYVACGVDSFRASHNCAVGDLPYAVFTDRFRSHTRYRKCVTVPGGNRYCATQRTGSAGRPHQRPLNNDSIGPHKVQWYVGGHLVREWRYYMHIGD